MGTHGKVALSQVDLRHEEVGIHEGGIQLQAALQGALGVLQLSYGHKTKACLQRALGAPETQQVEEEWVSHMRPFGNLVFTEISVRCWYFI